MKFLRHILSHLFLIIFLLAVVSVFYYRTLLLPAEVVAKIDGYVNNVYPPAVKFSSKREYFWSIKGKRIVSFDDLNLFKKDDAVVAEKEEKTNIATIDNDSSTSTEKEVKVVTTIKTHAPVVTPVPDSIDVEKAEKKSEIIATTKPEVESKVQEKIVTKVKDSDTSAERNLLIDARNAFNKGNISTSEKLYLELTRLEQDNPDAFGELGNVYYSQGKWDKAGQAYYEAAVRLIAEGHYNQVSYLQQVISGLNAEYAEKLSQQIMSR